MCEKRSRLELHGKLVFHFICCLSSLEICKNSAVSQSRINTMLRVQLVQWQHSMCTLEAKLISCNSHFWLFVYYFASLFNSFYLYDVFNFYRIDFDLCAFRMSFWSNIFLSVQFALFIFLHCHIIFCFSHCSIFSFHAPWWIAHSTSNDE